MWTILLSFLNKIIASIYVFTPNILSSPRIFCAASRTVTVTSKLQELGLIIQTLIKKK